MEVFLFARSARKLDCSSLYFQIQNGGAAFAFELVEALHPLLGPYSQVIITVLAAYFSP